MTKSCNNCDIDCDVLVVGGGHAGCEAAAASGRVGAKTLLLTADPQALSKMSCNPAIGGIAKGHLVREIDALGGLMPDVTDRTAIQFRVLNRSKGFAVWSPRAQCDRLMYSAQMYRQVQALQNIEIIAGTAVDLIVRENRCCGAVLDDGREILAKSVILTCGTFLNGLLHFGENAVEGGRIGEEPVRGMSERLVEYGFTRGRLKTGTPPRIDGSTIDYSLLERQDSDEEPIFFSTVTTQPYLPQKPCWIAYTNPYVHNEIHNGLDRSPLYSGKIKGVGPRYCPSIEDKIVRFSHKERHTIFLEPEGLDTDLIYPNGFSTSLPVDVQLKALRKIKGLVNVEITQPGYAVEYDYFPPHQLRNSLETKPVCGLYFAGQINGTSGYEEAAAQGLIAGCNAAISALGSSRTLTLQRNEAYIGVLIDDIITRGTEEPYRMFTSRAEFRLLLRLDNAEARLLSKAAEFGLVPVRRLDNLKQTERILNEVRRIFDRTKQRTESGEIVSLTDLLRRPEIKIAAILEMAGEEAMRHLRGVNRPVEFLRRIESEIKYEGYLKRQSFRVTEFERNRRRLIPALFDYRAVRGLSSEGVEKLELVKPSDLGQAANISGITPADLAVILVHLKRMSINR